MAQGSFNHSKTVKKSRNWHWHGKHKGMLTIAINKNKEQRSHPSEPMFDSVAEAFKAAKQKHKR